MFHLEPDDRSNFVKDCILKTQDDEEQTEERAEDRAAVFSSTLAWQDEDPVLAALNNIQSSLIMMETRSDSQLLTSTPGLSTATTAATTFKVLPAPPSHHRTTKKRKTGSFGEKMEEVLMAYEEQSSNHYHLAMHIFGLLTTASSLEDLDDMVQSTAVVFSSPSSGVNVEKLLNNLQRWLQIEGSQLDETAKEKEPSQVLNDNENRLKGRAHNEVENGKSRLQQTKEEVEEVKDIMLDNLNKAEERSGKLGELEDRADMLLAKSKAFEKTSNQVKQQKRWENKKMKVVFIGIGVVTAVIIIGLIIFAIVG
ncbi:hypothetical protein F2P81_013639 [Scophthalmus maximus]|uniref:V-SNARE coiled-coil homology domain-containing protein n=1 Tax=Scophthalmus maximus TaxID=52904 RepID=A0A6A4SHF3_SCOMX|nr:hypothetical protein F2P81_013639 [Scophthalmus maximus]